MKENDDKMIKGMLIAIVVLVIAIGSLAIYNHKANAKWEAERQEAIAKVQEQQEMEEAALEEKSGKPTVDESRPAKYIPDEPKKAPETSKVDPVNGNPTPKTNTDPPERTSPPEHDLVPAITALSDADIQRLQSYPIEYSQGELFVSFADMYTNQRAECDASLKKFSPANISAYKKAKVGWLSSPRLVYIDSFGNYVVRGILNLTYYDSNPFELMPSIMYQCEVEYSLNNSVTDGKVTLKLENIKYLSSFKAVKLG